MGHWAMFDVLDQGDWNVEFVAFWKLFRSLGKGDYGIRSCNSVGAFSLVQNEMNCE